MKFSARVLSATVWVSVVNADLMFSAEEDIVCQGIDFATCSPDAQAFFAEQVEATFNLVYSPGRYLYDTHWIGVGASEGNRRRLQSGGHTGGNSGCTYCPTDDAFIKEGGDELEDFEAWNGNLTAALHASGFDCLKGAQNCDIDLSETPLENNLSAEITKKNEAAMRVQCQHVDWTSLTSAEKQFAAAKLQRAFNYVSDDKKKLQDTEWESGAEQAASLMEYLVGFSWSQGGLGYFRGGILVSSAVDTKNLRANSDVELAARWADMFESLLADSPFSSLSRANQCQIQIEVVASSAAVHP